MSRSDPEPRPAVSAPVDDWLSDQRAAARAALDCGDATGAERLARVILKSNGDDIDGLRLMAEALGGQGRYRSAAVVLEEAVQRGIASPPLVLDLVAALEAAGHEGRAREWLRRGAEGYPADGPLALRHARHLLAAGDVDGAMTWFARAAVASPNDPAPVFDLARCHYRRGQIDMAEKAFAHVLTLAPGHARAMTNVGLLRRRRGDIAGAIAWHERALALEPDLPEAHWNLGLALLAAGDLERGFAEYEWRFRRPGHAPVARSIPEWTGDDPAGRRVLISVEQGVGDFIQFIRYASDLKERGAVVLAEAHAGTEVLLKTALGVDDIVTPGVVTPGMADVHVPVMSLPHRLGLAREARSERIPYLAPTEAEAPPPTGDGAAGGPVVGLVWAGNPAHEDDRMRSVALEALRPLWEAPGWRFMSLQLGAAREQLPACADAARRVEDLAPLLSDYAATARVLTRIDHVVAVDTSIIHLAGALGRPATLLLNYHGDWRWPREDGPSRWYPTVTCLRRRRDEPWPDLARRALGTLPRG